MEQNKDSKTANEMGMELKEAMSKEMKNHIPHRLCKQKDNLPWVSPQIHKMIRKRDTLSMKKKQQLKAGSNDHKTKNIKGLKKAIQSEMRRAYWSYVESIITPMEDEGKSFRYQHILDFYRTLSF